MKYHSVFITRRDIDSGELYLDSFVSYDEKEENKMIKACNIRGNEFWEVDDHLALEMAKCKRNLASIFNCMKFRARMNMAHVHHFITDFKFTRSDCEAYVKFANKDKDALKKLREARV